MPMRCPTCSCIGNPRSYYQGSSGIGVVLLLFCFPAWILYELWRQCSAKNVCPLCGRGGMIPYFEPQSAPHRASAEALQSMVAAGPMTCDTEDEGKFQIDGVDRNSRMDTRWYCYAASERNAKTKAELEGIVVTRIVRIREEPADLDTTQSPEPPSSFGGMSILNGDSATLLEIPLPTPRRQANRPWDDNRIIRAMAIAMVTGVILAGLLMLILR